MTLFEDLQSTRGRSSADDQYPRDLPGILSCGTPSPLPPSLNAPMPRQKPEQLPEGHSFDRSIPLPFGGPQTPVRPENPEVLRQNELDTKQPRYIDNGDGTETVIFPSGNSIRMKKKSELPEQSFDRMAGGFPHKPYGERLGELPEGHSFEKPTRR